MNSNSKFLIGLVLFSVTSHSLFSENSYHLVRENFSFQTSDLNDRADKKFFQKKNITAIEYCHFLNTVAKKDPYHLYDQKMGADVNHPSIERNGLPGNYQYILIAGYENMPASYLSLFAATYYSYWLSLGCPEENDACEQIEESISNSFYCRGGDAMNNETDSSFTMQKEGEEVDFLLTSNNFSISIFSSVETLALTRQDASSDNTKLKEIAKASMIITGLLFASKVMIEAGSPEEDVIFSKEGDPIGENQLKRASLAGENSLAFPIQDAKELKPSSSLEESTLNQSELRKKPAKKRVFIQEPEDATSMERGTKKTSEDPYEEMMRASSFYVLRQAASGISSLSEINDSINDIEQLKQHYGKIYGDFADKVITPEIRAEIIIEGLTREIKKDIEQQYQRLFFLEYLTKALEEKYGRCAVGIITPKVEKIICTEGLTPLLIQEIYEAISHNSISYQQAQEEVEKRRLEEASKIAEEKEGELAHAQQRTRQISSSLDDLNTEIFFAREAAQEEALNHIRTVFSEMGLFPSDMNESVTSLSDASHSSFLKQLKREERKKGVRLITSWLEEEKALIDKEIAGDVLGKVQESIYSRDGSHSRESFVRLTEAELMSLQTPLSIARENMQVLNQKKAAYKKLTKNIPVDFDRKLKKAAILKLKEEIKVVDKQISSLNNHIKKLDPKSWKNWRPWKKTQEVSSVVTTDILAAMSSRSTHGYSHSSRNGSSFSQYTDENRSEPGDQFSSDSIDSLRMADLGIDGLNERADSSEESFLSVFCQLPVISRFNKFYGDFTEKALLPEFEERILKQGVTFLLQQKIEKRYQIFAVLNIFKQCLFNIYGRSSSEAITPELESEALDHGLTGGLIDKAHLNSLTKQSLFLANHYRQHQIRLEEARKEHAFIKKALNKSREVLQRSEKTFEERYDDIPWAEEEYHRAKKETSGNLEQKLCTRIGAKSFLEDQKELTQEALKEYAKSWLDSAVTAYAERYAREIESEIKRDAVEAANMMCLEEGIRLTEIEEASMAKQRALSLAEKDVKNIQNFIFFLESLKYMPETEVKREAVLPLIKQQITDLKTTLEKAQRSVNQLKEKTSLFKGFYRK